ncbi:MAG: PAS domain S-box protein [Alphaproteobacteria bacterium]|nr:PAS domain S-box protein [Alphaproteobacteria bacterium]
MDWLAQSGLTPHGFCLSWDWRLITAHVLADLFMAISYAGCGALIFWFGRRRPDMGPAVLFNALGTVFVMCGITHLSDIATIWMAGYELQAVLKVSSAAASITTVTILVSLAPRALAVPSIAQLQEANARLASERRTHAATAARLAQLGDAVEQNPNMIIVTDQDGTITYVNRAFERLTGHDRANVTGRKPSILRSPDTPQWVHENLWQAIRAREVWRGELKDVRSDGTVLWVSASIAPLRGLDNEVTGYVAIHQDITDRKLAEEELIQARRQADIANRAKSEMLANMSHELRTPLNAIIGFSSAMRMEMFGPLGAPKYGEYIGDILSSAEHLLELINDVLDMSAIEAGKIKLFEERFAPAGVVDATLRLVAQRAAEGGVSLAFRDDLPCEVIADERRLKQVVINLLTNAIKFTPPGGTVTVSLSRAGDGGVLLAVKDSGIGMDPDEIEKALQPFGQVDGSLQRKHEGTGLGLPICIGIMECHGGYLVIASAKGVGTEVKVVLPPSRVVRGESVAP